jgi:IclR family pca regulon transcriptional regulator
MEFVKSLARGLQVIQVMGASRGAMTLSEVAAEAGMTRAAARRFLHTLTALGYARLEGRHFSLTPKMLSLSGSYLASDSLPDLAHPFLKELTARIHESSSLSVLEGNEIVYVARVPTQRIMSVNIQIGTRFPAWCTSMGRAQLAFLPQHEQKKIIRDSKLKAFTRHTITTAKGLIRELEKVHAQGYALVNQELEAGIISIAVPVFSRNGGVKAAANVAAHVSHITAGGMVEKVLPALQEAVSGIQQVYQD